MRCVRRVPIVECALPTLPHGPVFENEIELRGSDWGELINRIPIIEVVAPRSDVRVRLSGEIGETRAWTVVPLMNRVNALEGQACLLRFRYSGQLTSWRSAANAPE